MEARNLTINETSLSLSEARNILLASLDAQINSYKLNQLGNWTKDHSTASFEEDSNYQKLVRAREAFNALFLSQDSNCDVDLNISIEAIVKTSEEQKAIDALLSEEA